MGYHVRLINREIDSDAVTSCRGLRPERNFFKK